MKRKTTVGLLLFLIFAALLELVVVIVTNYHELVAIFSNDPSVSRHVASQLIAGVAILVVCWIALFILFVRQQTQDYYLCYGKKDPFTGIGNKNYLESRYKKFPFGFQNQGFLVYFGYENDLVLQNFDASWSEKLQKGTAHLLTNKCEDNEAVARIDETGFAMLLSCSNAMEAQRRIFAIINALDGYEASILMKIAAPFRCGFCTAAKEIPYETALKNAKTAYKYAGESEKGFCLFSESMNQRAEAQNHLRQKLQNAMDQNEFSVYLQFIFDAKKNRFVGAEALARWNSIQDGLVMPAEFIKQLYSVNLIEKFDLYMLDKVCALLEKWTDDPAMRDLRISCNVTRVSISSRSFAENFKKILRKYHFKNENLILEITEDSLIDNQTIAYQNIMACRELGFRIALDDFGAGNSSVYDINDYPVDEVKIDRCFIASLSNGKRSALILDGLIKMAHSMNIEAVCEGVETKTQNNIVTKLGADYIQGHYYSLVYPIEEAKSYYTSSLTASAT